MAAQGKGVIIDMNIKKLRRICDVRGCRNRETYSIVKKGGTGMSVIICEECLREAIAEIEKFKAPEKQAEALADKTDTAEKPVKKPAKTATKKKQGE